MACVLFVLFQDIGEGAEVPTIWNHVSPKYFLLQLLQIML